MDGSIKPGTSQSAQCSECNAKPTNLKLPSRRRDDMLFCCYVRFQFPSAPLLPSSVTPYPTQQINPPNRHLGATLPPERYLPPFPASDTSVCVYIHTAASGPPLYNVYFHSPHSTIAASRPNKICARMVIQKNNLPHTHCLTEHVSQYRMSDASKPETGAQSVLLQQIPGHGDGQKKEASIWWE